MAKIIIKGRVDPLKVSQQTALKVKKIWLDPTTEKSRRLDLGEWAGEYGQIKFIELEKNTNGKEIRKFNEHDLNLFKAQMIDYRMVTGDEDFLERVETIKTDILEEKEKPNWTPRLTGTILFLRRKKNDVGFDIQKEAEKIVQERWVDRGCITKGKFEEYLVKIEAIVFHKGYPDYSIKNVDLLRETEEKLSALEFEEGKKEFAQKKEFEEYEKSLDTQ